MPLNHSDTYSATKHFYAFNWGATTFRAWSTPYKGVEVVSAVHPLLWFKRVDGFITIGEGQANHFVAQHDAEGNLRDHDALIAAAKHVAINHVPHTFTARAIREWNGQTLRLRLANQSPDTTELSLWLDTFQVAEKKDKQPPAGYEGWYELDKKTNHPGLLYY